MPQRNSGKYIFFLCSRIFPHQHFWYLARPLTKSACFYDTREYTMHKGIAIISTGSIMKNWMPSTSTVPWIERTSDFTSLRQSNFNPSAEIEKIHSPQRIQNHTILDISLEFSIFNAFLPIAHNKTGISRSRLSFHMIVYTDTINMRKIYKKISLFP